MEGLGVAASIIAVLQLTGKLVSYLNDVKDAPKERTRCAREASGFYSMLVTLRYDLEDCDPAEPWFQAMRSLGSLGGPLDSMKVLLEALVEKIDNETDTTRRKFKGMIVWKFDKEEIANLLTRLERLRAMVQLALQRDHL